MVLVIIIIVFVIVIIIVIVIRDAHTGAHSRRGDLETLGYNLVHWASGIIIMFYWQARVLVQSPNTAKHKVK